VSEPDAAPQPEPYVWVTAADKDADVIAILSAALAQDYDSAVAVLSSLSDEQTVRLVWSLSRWFVGELAQSFENPAGELQALARVIGRGRAA
jgi:hypothetical protein